MKPHLLRIQSTHVHKTRRCIYVCFCAGCVQALQPLLSPKEAAGTRDNALGAVARVLAGPGAAAALPLESMLPPMLAALPLREDLSEAEPVYGMLCGLLTGDQAQRLVALVPSIVAAFGCALAQVGLPAGAKANVARTLAALRVQYPAALEPLLAALPAEQQAALAAALS